MTKPKSHPPASLELPSEEEESAAWDRIEALANALGCMIAASNTNHPSEAIRALLDALCETIEFGCGECRQLCLDQARQMFDQMMRDLAETRPHDPDPDSGSLH
jgi:hypothetical protein